MLIGAIIAMLLFAAALAFIKMYGEKSLPPAIATEEKIAFNKLKFGDGEVEAKIQFTDRDQAGANKMCCYILYGLIVAQFGIGLVLIGMSNTKLVGSGPCPKGMVNSVGGPGISYTGPKLCIPESMWEEIEKCESSKWASTDGWRRMTDVLADAEVGESTVHGRFLLTKEESGVHAVFRHDLWSGLAVMHNSQVQKFEALADQVMGRQSADDSGRRLQEKTDLWGAFEQNVEVPAVLLAVMLILVPTWLFVLKQFTQAVVWGTLLLDLAGLIWLMIRGEFEWPFIAMTVIFLLLVFIFRNKIKTAIEMLKLATHALGQTPSVFAANLVLFFVYVFYVAFWEMAIIASTGVVVLQDCERMKPGFIDNAVNFMVFMFLPMTFFFMNCKLVICACGLGAWYFHSDDPQKPKSPAFVGLKWAFYDSAGPTFVAALIQYAVHELRKVAVGNCWFCHPIGCFFRMLWCCIEGTVRAFTKFMLLGHVFHGGGVVKTARAVYATLKKHMGDAITTDFISVQVVTWSTCIFAVGMGFAGWIWMDQALFGTSSMAMVVQAIPADVAIVVFACVLLYFSKYPLCTLVVIGLTQGMITQYVPEAIGFLTALFLTSITSIVFMFVGGIVHNSTDTMLYCVALERETGKEQERFRETYEALKKTGVVQGTPVGEVAEGAVVEGRDTMTASQWPQEEAPANTA